MSKENGFYELRLFTENTALKKRYQEVIQNHNHTYTNNPHMDSGFDLFVPMEQKISERSTSTKINHEIKCAMVFHTYKQEIPSAFYLYPRSSTGSKSPLRLANSVGIIDSGYRGNIIGVFDNISSLAHQVESFTRLTQICAPTLEPFMVTLVETEYELGTTTRNCGAFGSTGE